MADVDLRNTLEEVGKEEGVETEAQETPSASPEETSPEVEETQEDKDLKGLDNDDEFKEAIKEVEDEQKRPLSFGQTQRFRKLYWEAKEGKRTGTEKETRIAELEEEVENFKNNVVQQPQAQPEVKEATKQLTTIQDLVDKAQNPQDREFLKNYADAIKKDALEGVAKEHGEFLKEVREFVEDSKHERKEMEAHKFIDNINKEHDLTIDYEKNIVPEIVKMIRSNPNLNRSNMNMLMLTKEVLANIGPGLGKQFSQKEQRKLNETKKQAAMETAAPTGAPKVDDSKSSPADIMKDVESKMGAGSFQ